MLRPQLARFSFPRPLFSFLLTCLLLLSPLAVGAQGRSYTLVNLGPGLAVASLPSATTTSGQLWLISDGLTATDCTAGGGTSANLCLSNGAAYVLFVGAGAAGDITAVGDCASGACFQSKAANTVLAGPTSGGATIAAFRALVFADIPSASTATASTIVARDGSGNFAATTITAALTGNATTATTAANLTSPHFTTTGSAPGTLTAGCGTGATITGTDRAGFITIGTTPTTACGFTFAAAWGSRPVCIAQNETAANLTRSVSTISALTINGVFTAADIVGYTCVTPS